LISTRAASISASSGMMTSSSCAISTRSGSKDPDLDALGIQGSGDLVDAGFEVGDFDFDFFDCVVHEFFIQTPDQGVNPPERFFFSIRRQARGARSRGLVP
jgi:hypothetical protein